MKFRISTYIPFQHEDFDYVRALIQNARDQYGKSSESTLSSVLIYINAVDYIVDHVLTNLRLITHAILFQELNSDLYFQVQKNKKGSALGTMISELKQFHFVNKEEFIKDLDEFNKRRKLVAHNLLRLNVSQRGKIDSDIQDLRELAEDLFIKYDAIARSINNTWNSYVSKNAPLLPESPEAPTNREKEKVDSEKN